ncbi:hypothetical protein [Microbulbifer sp. 2201CG32-9]
MAAKKISVLLAKNRELSARLHSRYLYQRLSRTSPAHWCSGACS